MVRSRGKPLVAGLLLGQVVPLYLGVYEGQDGTQSLVRT